MSANPVALEFAHFVLQSLPPEAEFLAIYDAMSRAANRRSFRNLGHDELAQIGVSFSLLATAELESLIEEARRTMRAPRRRQGKHQQGQGPGPGKLAKSACAEGRRRTYKG
jgi:hypothetical protein